MSKIDVLDRLSDKSIRLLKNINPSYSKGSEISVEKVISEISKEDDVLKSLIQSVKIPIHKQNVNVERWLTEAYYEAHLADSEKVENHHLLHALLLQVSTEKYYIAKKQYFSGFQKRLSDDLSGYVQNLNEIVKKSNYKFIGRKKELTHLIVNLTTPNMKPTLLIAEEGAGKTSLMMELARKINEKEVPSALIGVKVVRVKFSAIVGLIPGDQSTISSVLLSKIFTYVANSQKEKTEKIIMFLDDFRIGPNFFVGVESKSELEDILLVGAAETDLLEGPFESNVHRLWEVLLFDEMKISEYEEILAQNAKIKFAKSKIVFDNDAISKIVELTKADFSYPTELPGSGIKALNLLATYKRHITNDYDVIKAFSKDLERKAKVASLRDLYSELTVKNVSSVTVTEKDVFEFLSFNQDKEFIDGSITFDFSSLQDIENFMKSKVIGQDSAIETLSRALRISSLKLDANARPIGIFMFLGPTGVGKTYCAKILAQALYGFRDKNKQHPSNFIRIDMSEYSEKHSVSKLFGAPPGYIGYDDQASLLDFVKDHPSSVVLFDEIDKAHPEVLNSLLHIMDEAELRNNSGDMISFENVIVVMTSNHGADIIGKKDIGFTDSTSRVATRKALISNLKKALRPEFLNRFDDIIVFDSLTNENYFSILDLMLEPIIRKLKERGVKLTIKKTAKKYLIRKSDYSEYGARELRRVLNKDLVDEISKILLKNINTKSIDVKAEAKILKFKSS